MPNPQTDYEQLWNELEAYLQMQEQTAIQDVRHGTLCEVLTKMEELRIRQDYAVQPA